MIPKVCPSCKRDGILYGSGPSWQWCGMMLVVQCNSCLKLIGVYELVKKAGLVVPDEPPEMPDVPQQEEGEEG